MEKFAEAKNFKKKKQDMMSNHKNKRIGEKPFKTKITDNRLNSQFVIKARRN